MINVLNITNGDCTVELMKKAGISGDYLPWRDVLHEGPVPAYLSLEELSDIRARFISEKGWGELGKVQQSFLQRDERLKSYNNYQKIILWFEHDLYDQLQILQILDWFSDQDLTDTCLSLICTDQYLGMLSPENLLDLYQYETKITDAHLNLAKYSWAAFRKDRPDEWYALLETDTSALSFLHSAIVRMIQEFPNQLNGLSRTEQQVLTIISEGVVQPGKVFAENQKLEQSIFMGDSSFWDIINAFLSARPALLSLSKGKELILPISPEQELSITSVATNVLSGKQNWTEIKELNRWIGGVHLTPNNRWCWDALNNLTITKY